MHPGGYILHVAGSHSKIFQVSPEPKRCVERKVLNCLARIIAQLSPAVGGHLQKIHQPHRGLASSSVGRTDLASISYCKVRVEILRGNPKIFPARHLTLPKQNYHGGYQYVHKQAYQEKHQNGPAHVSPQIAQTDDMQELVDRLISPCRNG